MQRLSYRKQRASIPRTLPPAGRNGSFGGAPVVSENLNARMPSKYLNRGTVLPAASDVPDYFTVDVTISSGTNVDYLLFDANGFALAANGLSQGANTTVTSGGTAAIYTALAKVIAQTPIQVVGIDYYSSTNDQKTLYLYKGDLNASTTKVPLFVLPGKSPMQNNQAYLKLDTNFVLGPYDGLMVRIASSSETVRLGFHIASSFNRIQ